MPNSFSQRNINPASKIRLLRLVFFISALFLLAFAFLLAPQLNLPPETLQLIQTLFPILAVAEILVGHIIIKSIRRRGIGL